MKEGMKQGLKERDDGIKSKQYKLIDSLTARCHAVFGEDQSGEREGSPSHG